jgi:hypothetical protein
MLDNRILLTTPTYPYPTLPANESLTDAGGQRFELVSPHQALCEEEHRGNSSSDKRRICFVSWL